jgi:GT2 family glycosyltransferase
MLKKNVIVIPYYENIDLLEKCLISIEKNANLDNLSVVLVDDCSATNFHPNYSWLEKIIRLKERSGFTKAVNRGLEYSFNKGADNVILLNSDMELLPGAIEHLIAYSKLNKHAGLVGGIEISMDDSSVIINAGTRPIYKNGKLTNLLDLIRADDFKNQKYNQLEPLEWVSFGIVLITKLCYEAVGNLDEQFLNYFSDTDYCHRAQLENFEVWLNPASKVYHKKHQTTKLYLNKNLMKLQVDREAYYNKWLPHIPYEKNDRYWNIHINSSLKNWYPKILPHFDSSIPFISEYSPIKEEVEKRKSDLILLSTFDNWDNCSIETKRAIRNLYLDGFLFLQQRFFHEGATIFMDGHPLVALSPHADDIALSIGGLMLSRRRTENKTRICTFFNDSNYTVSAFHGLSKSDVSFLRAVEETFYTSYITAQSQIFDLPDKLVREPNRSIYLNAPHEVNAELVERAKEIILEKVVYFEECFVLCPLGAGLMEDHVIIATAICELMQENIIPPQRVFVYDDIPYATTPENINKGLSIFSNFGFQLAPRIYDVTPWFEQKRELLNVYKTQMEDYLFDRTDISGLNLIKIKKGEDVENWRRAERVWTITRADED